MAPMKEEEEWDLDDFSKLSESPVAVTTMEGPKKRIDKVDVGGTGSPVGTNRASSSAAATEAAADHDQDDKEDHEDPTFATCAGRASRRMARNPCCYFMIALLSSLAVSVIGFIVGDFTVSVDNTGWISRGTSIADQSTQILLLNRLDPDVFNNNDALWDDLITNVQDGFEDESVDGDEEEEGEADRRLTTTATATRRQLRDEQDVVGITAQQQQQPPTGFMACEAASFYLDSLRPQFVSSRYTNLWPVWKGTDESINLLDPQAIENICTAEQTTQRLLQEAGLCGGCSGNRFTISTTIPNTTCFPPVSLVLLVRYYLLDFELKLSCTDLAKQYETIRSQVEIDLSTLVNVIRSGNIASIVVDHVHNNGTMAATPFAAIIPFLVDDQFGIPGTTDAVLSVRYSTSIFSTAWAGNATTATTTNISSSSISQQQIVDGLFDLRSNLDRSGGGGSADDSIIIGAYDTSDEDFLDIVVDELVVRDMTLAVASALVTALAMLIHTRSPFLTIIGLAQIIISFPLAFFFYNVILRLTFFPFLNFIGVFVTFALGADDVFVACDKWKNARLEYPRASVEFIAAKAFPDAAQAMFLTSVTTAIAFFSTAICPTTALKMFAIFLGLLIMFDYFLCIALIFPALCLYDRWNRAGRCCCLVAIGTNNNKTTSDDEEKKESLIRRILSGYYEFLHRFRYLLLVVVVGLTVLCCVVASNLKLPTTSEVRLLGKGNELEKVYSWKLNLFAAELDQQGGSRVWAVWGLLPADNGDVNDPTKSSTLVLDDTFDPSPEANQLHLLQFCDDLFAQDFYAEVRDNLCSMKRFDEWLADQSVSNSSSVSYTSSCGGASGVPVSPDNFDACIIGFAQEQENTDIFYRDDKVKIIRAVYLHSGVAYDSAYDIIDEGWNNITTFLKEQNANGPEGVNKVFASSLDFWWYDTNGSILSTAFGAISIALAAAFVVVLLSTRSFEITLVAIFTIGFILAAVTAMLVATGWTLGFLESVCFAILVGMSCDFVLHLGHAYSHRPGIVSRHERSKEALILMGPSILAASVTTIASALVMMFTQIIFFQRFAVILFYSLIMGLFGAVFVFLVLTDMFGPAEPTFFVDSLLRCGAKKEAEIPPTDDKASTKATNKDATTDDFEVHA